jgi:hypothetical protein
MLAGLSGPALTLAPGDEHDFPQADASRLVAAGFAVPVSERTIETTVQDTTAVERRRGRPRKAE